MTRFALTLVLVATLTGCGAGSGGGRDAVVAGFYPLAYAADRIAGDDFDVRNLTPPGVEPHDFELSARSVTELGDARLVLYLGDGFQPALVDAIASTDAEALDLLDGLDLHAPDGEASERGNRDPHVWLDPTLYADMVLQIGGALGRDPPAQRLAGELQELDLELRQGLSDCERREIVTSHAAFGYLAARYDLEQIAITGLSPEAEPSPAALRELVEEVRSHGATTVFFETLVSPRLAETVAREVGATTAVLNPVEGLSEEEADEGADYFSLMRGNLAALRQALGCR